MQRAQARSGDTAWLVDPHATDLERKGRPATTGEVQLVPIIDQAH
jgi:hypothetical protein